MNPITTSFDVKEMAITLAKLTFKGAKEMDFVTGYIDIEGPDYSPLPDGVEVHAQYGFGPMQKRGETDAFAFDAPGPAGTKKRYYEAYALAASITERLILYSKNNIVGRIPQELGKSWRLRQNIHVASVYDDFFTGATFTEIDGVHPLGSTAHTTWGAPGITRTNITDGALGYATLQAILTIMRKQKSERGQPLPAIMDSIDLIIPPAYEMDADKYTNPMALKDPTNNHNAINVLQSRKWNIKINPFFTSETAWFCADPTAKGIKLVNKQKLTTDTNPDIETKGVRHDVRAMWTIIEEEWERMYGSAG